MTGDNVKRRAAYLLQPLEKENMRLRFQLQQAKEQIRQERKARHLIEEELAFVRQQQANRERARQWNNGAMA